MLLLKQAGVMYPGFPAFQPAVHTCRAAEAVFRARPGYLVIRQLEMQSAISRPFASTRTREEFVWICRACSCLLLGCRCVTLIQHGPACFVQVEGSKHRDRGVVHLGVFLCYRGGLPRVDNWERIGAYSGPSALRTEA